MNPNSKFEMDRLDKELVYLIHQFLDEAGQFKETVHTLEQESGFFFNMTYFDEKVQAGDWEQVENYLSGFTEAKDNRYSMKMFFEIKKQKYLETLDRNDIVKAVDILRNELKFFLTSNEELYNELSQLMGLNNFRENQRLSKHGDAETSRSVMLMQVKKLIMANPLFREKLAFPTFKSGRLKTMINQSLNWQNHFCNNPRQNPDMRTLFTEHLCGPSCGASTSATLPAATVAKPSAYQPLGAHALFRRAAETGNATALAGWIASTAACSSVEAPVATASVLPVPPNQVSTLKRPLTSPVTHQSIDHEQLTKRLRPTPSVEEGPSVSPLITYPTSPQHATRSLDDLPGTVACTMDQGSAVTSMDFHPYHHTMLIVGSACGEVTLWDVKMREKVASMPFKIWDMANRSQAFQVSLAKNGLASVIRATWSPDGSFIGVAFNKNLIHLYAYTGLTEFLQHLEIEAHNGIVNDLAFLHLNKELCVATCGDDKLIKVWDITGRKLFTFDGHEAPVYSICPHQKENVQFMFSTSIDGKIKAWLYDNLGPRIDFDALGCWCTTLLYSADGSRLFSCGTSKSGDSFLVEWDDTEGTIKRTYSGLGKRSPGLVVQFDTTQNRFLAVGEDEHIKFWDMDDVNILTSTDAEGGLSSLPRLRFNKEGSLLAVTTDNGIKILATATGLRSLRTVETSSMEVLRSPIKPIAHKASNSTAAAIFNAINSNLERSSPTRNSPALD